MFSVKLFTNIYIQCWGERVYLHTNTLQHTDTWFYGPDALVRDTWRLTHIKVAIPRQTNADRVRREAMNKEASVRCVKYTRVNGRWSDGLGQYIYMIITIHHCWCVEMKATSCLRICGRISHECMCVRASTTICERMLFEARAKE